MGLRKSTRIWLAVLVIGLAGKILLDRFQPDGGCAAAILFGLAIAAFLTLLLRGVAVLFRLIVRRTTLRLAFSYFLIGIVPIPLAATMLLLSSYIVAHQYVANRLRREITAIGEAAAASRTDLPVVRRAEGGRVGSSGVEWLRAGEQAPWLEALARPGFLLGADRLWLAVPRGPGAAALLDLSDPAAAWAQRLADATGYEVGIELGDQTRTGKGLTVKTSAGTTGAGIQVDTSGGPRASPPKTSGAAPEATGPLNRTWIRAYYLETLLNAVGEQAESGRNVAVLTARTSPRVIFDQLFTQGVSEINRAFWIALVGVGASLLLVYLAALTIAFVLAGSIARNVNRLTRATAAVARGDFSVSVGSKSLDQIGDLGRSFDAMAASMQKLLSETARKERLESDIAIAQTIQRKLLPAAEARLPGFTVHTHFEPVAEIGGDYYDFLPMPDGRTAVALGDVSGHGLPTGLLVAMVKAALSTLLEAGHRDGELFGRLNELIHRSTDPRHFMTLALLAYDSTSLRGTLTNAGQLAPYRLSGGTVESISLNSFPLGLFPERSFPSREVTFAPGDLVVLFSDGMIEGVDANDEPFGFERFEAVLRARAADGAIALRDALLEAVRAHAAGRPADDDRTLVILTLDPPVG